MMRLALSIIVATLSLSIGIYAADKTYEPTWASINSRPLPTWYDQSKFGIFIHWGVYSVPHYGSALPEWYWYNYNNPSEDGGATQRFHNTSFGPNFQYQKFAENFNAYIFDPDQWADLFKKAGAKYVVLTSKHHEGFCLWQSPQSWGWNSVDVGPNKDLVAMVTNSVRKAGLKMGLYHSLYEWYNPIYDADKATGQPPTQSKYVDEIMLPQLYDIIQKYEPSVIWADGDWEQYSAYWKSTEFLAWLYTNSTVKDEIVTNDRWGAECPMKDGGYFTPYDRYNPGKSIGHKWENCYTIGQNWGYNENEPFSGFQSATDIIYQLVSTVSCGGNLLLDVGPTPDGLIPWIMQERLLQIGAWMDVNNAAIYDTIPWRAQNDTAEEQIWYTTNPNTLDVYCISFVWPTNGILSLTQPLASSSTQVFLLGCTPSTACNTLSYTVNKAGSGFSIKLPSLPPTGYPNYAYVFVLKNVK
ncbi:alpha-fucosidase [Cavenderia fasciculata]|uniref:alpha-L-fucosidase n=1 Tax=Cavenderia fasciculata TaxID=261658 RepID=F4QFM4_CACFS|nr:alpha-fucosidase [Cavenderia fasciculata]EGG13477.1 alpha-fucosidase [Cavenderia fasciculata]|eukprot:XP_004350181.1 alpha-fucosidase [Cavenderia fasciculata]